MDIIPAPDEDGPPPLVCPQCQQPNPPALLICVHCQALLRPADQPAPGLALVAGGQEYPCKNGDILGREGTVARQFFLAIGEVSRQHAAVSQRAGEWFLEALPNVPNLTELDGQPVRPGTAQRLTGQHRLKMSTKCEVQLRVVSS
jgi:hypothetical protein